ncbi:GGDEF domain-containing protein [Hydrogenimonas sp. SS33]|uniref:GGDEF domain-containing protein n=1 Tax=Hydrogenimonas leucolamina TaxID=2954236 RepID=UPI00336C1CBD
MNEEIYWGLIGAALLAATGAGAGWAMCSKKLGRSRKKIDAMAQELQEARSLDEATGAFNYPFFVKAANVQIKLARRHRWPVTLMVVDIDQLERVNLRYSFRMGDSVLKHLADSIRSVVRSSDVLGRFGGSGIFILLPECDIDNIRTVYDRIVEKVSGEPLIHNGKKIDYHFTGGAVTMYGVHIHLNQMLGLAEDALNAAKEKKKDIVIFDKEGLEVKQAG